MGSVIAVPVGSIDLIGGDPIYTESKFTPLVFLNMDGGRVLFDDPYGIWQNGNITERGNNYAFTGEQIQWEVLVWDKNGVPEKLQDVYAGWANQSNGPVDPEPQANCGLTDQPQRGESLVELGYPNIRRPGDQEDQEEFNPDTMGIYLCLLTIEPQAHGQKWMGVKAVDLDGLSGTMMEAESWFLNPAMSISTSGTIDFGELGPGERGSSTISVTNDAEEGSGMMVVFRISGTDFYDPNPSGGRCPTTNSLSLGQFRYSAVQGINQVSNMGIPYGTSVVDSRTILGDGVMTSPGSDISLTLELELPQPCNGQFTDGSIFLWAIAG